MRRLDSLQEAVRRSIIETKQTNRQKELDNAAPLCYTEKYNGERGMLDELFAKASELGWWVHLSKLDTGWCCFLQKNLEKGVSWTPPIYGAPTAADALRWSLAEIKNAKSYHFTPPIMKHESLDNLIRLDDIIPPRPMPKLRRL